MSAVFLACVRVRTGPDRTGQLSRAGAESTLLWGGGLQIEPFAGGGAVDFVLGQFGRKRVGASSPMDFVLCQRLENSAISPCVGPFPKSRKTPIERLITENARSHPVAAHKTDRSELRNAFRDTRVS